MFNSFITWASRTPWLSGSAIWAVTAASALLNAWGWAATATGLVALLLVTLAVSLEILGVRLALRIEDQIAHKTWAKVIVAGVLMCGVVAFNCYSGHRALEMVEYASSAPYLEAEAQRAAAQAEVDRINAEIAAIPELPANVFATRLRAYLEARNAELARLEPQRAAAQAALDALPALEPPTPAIPSPVKWAILALVEALKALALWSIVNRQTTAAKPAAAQAYNPARELARKRWGQVEVTD